MKTNRKKILKRILILVLLQKLYTLHNEFIHTAYSPENYIILYFTNLFEVVALTLFGEDILVNYTP